MQLHLISIETSMTQKLATNCKSLLKIEIFLFKHYLNGRSKVSNENNEFIIFSPHFHHFFQLLLFTNQLITESLSGCWADPKQAKAGRN